MTNKHTNKKSESFMSLMFPVIFILSVFLIPLYIMSITYNTTPIDGTVIQTSISFNRYGESKYLLLVQLKDESSKFRVVNKELYLKYISANKKPKSISINCTYSDLQEQNDLIYCLKYSQIE